MAQVPRDRLRQLPLPFPLAPSARFETFVAGRDAGAVAALRPARPDPAPLWLWGEPGCGKSHLLQAACAAAGTARAMYLPLAALKGSDPRMLEGLEALDLVALDDAEAVAGEPAWERALFGLANGLQAEGGRLIWSACRPPAGVEFSLADLASRAAGATVYRLEGLSEDEDRIAALRIRARFRGMELPARSAMFLLHRVPRDMSALCRWLDTLDYASLSEQRKLTVPFIRSALGDNPVTGR